MRDPNDRAGYLALPLANQLYPHRETDLAIVERIRFWREMLMAKSRPFGEMVNPTQVVEAQVNPKPVFETPVVEVTTRSDWQAAIDSWEIAIPPAARKKLAERLNDRRAAFHA